MKNDAKIQTFSGLAIFFNTKTQNGFNNKVQHHYNVRMVIELLV